MSSIAIIGSGISGLTCAHLLNRSHDITLYEANDYIGGHTATKTVSIAGKTINVDTGFIVFNDWTYPNFIKLLDSIGADSQPTTMGFSVKCKTTGLEYSGENLNTLFAQRKNILNPGFLRMIRDILRFNKSSIQDLESGNLPADMTLGEYLKQNQYSDRFVDWYLIPMGSAIWSASLESMMEFPLQFFVRFFKNHGLLSVNHRPQWRVVSGGSASYVDKLIKPFSDKIKLNTPVKHIQRQDNSATITLDDGSKQIFDHVILACHSDQALKLLNDPSPEEQEILSAIPYQENEVVLHTDTALLPKNRKTWSSWNYHLTGDTDKPAAVTYNMNILQGFDCRETVCVTLNHSDKINPSKILGEYRYAHPVFTLDGMNAQQRWREINEVRNTWFCGAYWLNGFHEDGVNSALRVAAAFGEKL
jgi:predicted NAD/FAD-binding protein